MSKRGHARSPSLEVPRKSVELQDPGARELDDSSDDGQVFSDAHDKILPPLQIPITRVEKVDNSPSHGEVPGTPAYAKRMQDAVPDEIEIIPDGQRSRASSRAIPSPSSASPSHSPVPLTRVEKVDPASPSYGDVPGTPGWEKRRADAIPDSIDRATPENRSPTIPPQPATPTSIPKTVITRVDSMPAHGEVPEEGHSESTYFRRVMPPSDTGQTPIAEDGGFGPMNYESNSSSKTSENGEAGDEAEDEGFDDFAEGEGDDFGDFDDFEDGFGADEVTPQPPAGIAQPVSIDPPAFPVLDFSTDYSLESLIDAMLPHSKALFPALQQAPDDPAPPLPDSHSAFLTDRSLLLWQQLVAPPELQPPNWVRSRIRRLFLVSLGVPVDLDEILPKSKQKKLVLQYSPEARRGDRRASTAKKRDGHPTDEAESSTTATSKTTSRKHRGPPPPPEFNSAEIHTICNKTTADMENMSDADLQAHIKLLEQLLETGKEVLQYWVRRKEAAVGEKEAFDGVIENLVRHARRVRK